MATATSLILAAPLTDKPTDGRLGNNDDNYNEPPPPVPEREDFPDDFLFGTGTGAYQVEGAAALHGKGPSVWDDWTSRTPNNITDGGNGNIACDMYHRYTEDIKAMKTMGFDAYRFSISWPRILPGGRASTGRINRNGIDFYNRLINTVIDNGLKPCVTLFHWDTPLVLEKEYDGFLSKKILEDFREYVELCFSEFGDRVKWWTTVNEPWTYAVHGYVNGIFPPGETSGGSPLNLQRNVPAHRSDLHTRPLSSIRLSKGSVIAPNPAKDAYTVTRNLLLAHATAVHSYRTKFQDTQNGVIGIVLNSHWHLPYDDENTDDQEACTRAVDFMLGWFLDPILKGEYPESMQKYVPKENLAGFTNDEMRMLKGSIDYLGLNYYTTNFAQNDDTTVEDPNVHGYNIDQKVKYSYMNSKGVLVGDPTASAWLYVAPRGIYDHLKYLADTYSSLLPPVYITENGVSQANNFNLISNVCKDTQRMHYHQDHLAYIKKAIDDFKDKLDVKGYFVWSYCDNFEWKEGYSVRFGITYIDYINHQKRYPKNSALWFAKFLTGSPKKTPKKRPIENEDTENGQAEKRARGGEE